MRILFCKLNLNCKIFDVNCKNSHQFLHSALQHSFVMGEARCIKTLGSACSVLCGSSSLDCLGALDGSADEDDDDRHDDPGHEDGHVAVEEVGRPKQEMATSADRCAEGHHVAVQVKVVGDLERCTKRPAATECKVLTRKL